MVPPPLLPPGGDSPPPPTPDPDEGPITAPIRPLSKAEITAIVDRRMAQKAAAERDALEAEEKRIAKAGQAQKMTTGLKRALLVAQTTRVMMTGVLALLSIVSLISQWWIIGIALAVNAVAAFHWLSGAVESAETAVDTDGRRFAPHHEHGGGDHKPH